MKRRAWCVVGLLAGLLVGCKGSTTVVRGSGGEGNRSTAGGDGGGVNDTGGRTLTGGEGGDGATTGGGTAGDDGIGGASGGTDGGSLIGGRGGADAGSGGVVQHPTGGAGGETGGGGALLDCAQATLVTGDDVTLSTLGAGDDFQLGCGSPGQPDLAFEWTAPADGYYTVSATGSSIDTVLAVLTGDCGEPIELACNDDYASLPQSELVERFAAGQRVLVVVEGKAGSTGEVTLSIAPVACPAQDLTSQVFPISQTTVGGSNAQGGLCGGAGLRERTYRWTPPADGFYQFAVSSAVITPALHLERGARCGGDLLTCFSARPAVLGRFLPGGEPVTLIVDSAGGEGSFDLDVKEVFGSCPLFPALPADPEVAWILDDSAPDVLSGSCSPPLMSGTGQWASMHEHSYAVSLNYSGAGFLRVAVRGDQWFSAYVLRGSDCGGEERLCEVAEEVDGAYELSFSMNSSFNGDNIVVIESHSEQLTYQVYTMQAL